MSRVAAEHYAVAYGHDVGIIMIDCFVPFVPGDIGNARTFSYAVLYHRVPNSTIARVLEQGDPSLAPRIVEAAEYLQSQGVKAITSDCGYMIHYQKVVQERVKVPVMLSSLLQLPFISAVLHPDQSIGIICANSKHLTADMLAIAYPSHDRSIIVVGMEQQPEFKSAILDEEGSIDPSLVEAEVLEVGRELVLKHPSIGAILLECSDLPPYAKALQQVTKLPIFDFTTMIDFVRAACVRSSFPRGD